MPFLRNVVISLFVGLYSLQIFVRSLAQFTRCRFCGLVAVNVMPSSGTQSAQSFGTVAAGNFAIWMSQKGIWTNIVQVNNFRA